jgi:hypothetical protein
VEGQSSAGDGTGVKGIATNGGYAKGVYGVSGSGFGGYFSAASAAGWGLYAEGGKYGVNATALTDTGIAVLGTQPSVAGDGPGVEGVSKGTVESGGVGVEGIADLSIGVDGRGGDTGVEGDSTSGAGVWGFSDSGSGVNGSSVSGYAGKFFGDVNITGTLTKGAGAFKIDHPLHPAREYLQHSFVESPDMLDIYNGNVITNGRGFATVTMPDYFQAPNRSFRYQLTSLSGLQEVAVAKEISHNRFTIQSEKPLEGLLAGDRDPPRPLCERPPDQGGRAQDWRRAGQVPAPGAVRAAEGKGDRRPQPERKAGTAEVKPLSPSRQWARRSRPPHPP